MTTDIHQTPLRSGPLLPDELAEMLRLRARGMKIQDIADTVGRPFATVSRSLWEKGIGRSRPGARDLAERALAADAVAARRTAAEDSSALLYAAWHATDDKARCERVLRTLPVAIDLVSAPDDVAAAFTKIVGWCRGRIAAGCSEGMPA